MDSDRQLRAEVVRALDAVTPPAPWLGSTVRKSLRARSRPGTRMAAAARFTGRGLSVATAVALVLLIAATAVGILAIRSAGQLLPAHPRQGDVAAYAEMLKRDRQDLESSAGGTASRRCHTLALPDCPAALAREAAQYQRWLNDLGRTTPPTRFTTEHARMRANLLALIADINLAVAAFSAGDSGTLGPALNAAVVLRDELLTIEAYVVYESTAGSPAGDAGSAAYADLVARDYDDLHLPALISGLISCRPTDTACAASAATARSSIVAFLADLQVATPSARLAGVVSQLVAALGAELQALESVDAALAARDEAALTIAKQTAINAHGLVSIYASGILYAR